MEIKGFLSKNQNWSPKTIGIYLFLAINILVCLSSLFFPWGTVLSTTDFESTAIYVNPIGYTMNSPYGNVDNSFYSFLFETSSFQFEKMLSLPFLLTGIIIFPLWLIVILYAIWNLYSLMINKRKNAFGYNAGMISVAVLVSFLLVFLIGLTIWFGNMNPFEFFSLNIGFYLMLIATILFFVGRKITKKYLEI